MLGQTQPTDNTLLPHGGYDNTFISERLQHCTEYTVIKFQNKSKKRISKKVNEESKYEMILFSMSGKWSKLEKCLQLPHSFGPPSTTQQYSSLSMVGKTQVTGNNNQTNTYIQKQNPTPYQSISSLPPPFFPFAPRFFPTISLSHPLDIVIVIALNYKRDLFILHPVHFMLRFFLTSFSPNKFKILLLYSNHLCHSPM